MATPSDRILEADILIACKPLQWFIDHPTIVLKVGQIVQVKDDPRHKRGNGTTPLSALPWLGDLSTVAWSGITGAPTDNANLITYLAGNYEQLINKGVANGYASLDVGGKVPAAQLPANVMQYQGQWDASTNTPPLIDGIGNAGDVWEIVTAGTQDLGSGPVTYKIGDWVVYNGSIWEKSVNSNEVVSVNGLTGAVNLIAHNLLLTGYPGGVAGTVGAADSVREAISKLDGTFVAQNPIVTVAASSATLTPVITSNIKTDHAVWTALNTNATLAAPTGGTLSEGKMIIVSITDNLVSRTIGYNAIYRGSANMILPTNTLPGLAMYLGFRYNAFDGTLDLIAKSDGY